jgi:hypothetical protein
VSLCERFWDRWGRVPGPRSDPQCSTRRYLDRRTAQGKTLRLDEPDPVGTQVVEQPDTVTEQRRHEVDHHLVEQTGSEVLLRYVRASQRDPDRQLAAARDRAVTHLSSSSS